MNKRGQTRRPFLGGMPSAGRPLQTATQAGMAAAASIPTASSSAAPGTPSKFHKLGVVIFLLVIGIVDFFFSSDVTWLLGVNVLLALFGILHIFGKGIGQLIILGLLPLVLAIASLPAVVGGVSFISSIPFLGAIAPEGIVRYILLLVVMGYYYVATPSKQEYSGMAQGAGGAFGKIQWKFSPWKVIGVFFLIALIYGFENGAGISEMLGLGDVGLYLVPAILIMAGLIILFRKVVIDKIVGIISLLMGAIAVLDFMGYGYWVDGVFWPLMPGAFTRYIVITIILVYFILRGKAAAPSS